MHIKPLVAANLALERLIMDAIIKDFCAAARQTAKPRRDQITQHSKHALVPIATALGDALQMHNLYRSERLDMNLRRFFADGAQHVGVVTERKPRMQSAHNVHFRGAALACLARFCADVIQVVFVRAVLILLAMERAELATEGADVGIVQMPIDVVEDRVAMQASAHHVGQTTDFMDVRCGKEHGTIGRGEPLARLHFARDLSERRVAAPGPRGRVPHNCRCGMGARNRCCKRHRGERIGGMAGPANRRVTPGVPLFSMSLQANVTTLTARTARSLHQGGHTGLLSALLLSLMALLAATPVCRAATDSNISITVDRTVNFHRNWTLSVRLRTPTDPTAASAAAGPTLVAGTNGSHGFFSVNTMPFMYVNPYFDPYRNSFGGLNGLVIRYNSNGNSFVAFGSQPVLGAGNPTTMFITYNSRKDRLTVVLGRVRKVIPNVHSALAALGLADDPTVYIRDIAAQVTAGRVSAINGVQFNATAPQ